MTNRWMKFWPSDWQSDPALRMCSLAARGLWIEAICLAHAAEPYGHVLINGKPVTTRQFAVLVGSTPKEIEALLSELEEAGVFSRTPDGAIYSRRMVRDKAASEAGRENGKAGGNPTLRGKRTGGDNRQPKEGGLTPPLKLEAEAEAEAEADDNPLTPTAAAAGGLEASQNGRPRAPKGSRSAGTNPRAVAAAERASRPPPPEPDHPLWPRCRALDMTPDDFRRWVVPLVEVAGVGGQRVLVAPSRFHADHVRREFGAQHLAGFEVRANPEAAHG